MKQIKSLFHKYQSVIAYLFFGVLTTVINIAFFAVTVYMWRWNYQVGNVLAWFVAVLFAFFTNKVWVFGSKYSTVGAFMRELLLFFWYRGVTLIMELVIVYIGISLMHGNPIVVKIVDNIVVIIVNYVFSKFLIFNKHSETVDGSDNHHTKVG